MAGTNIVIPGAENAPSLFELLGPAPSPSPGGDVPVFRSQVAELDVYRIAFLIAGVLIGRLLK